MTTRQTNLQSGLAVTEFIMIVPVLVAIFSITFTLHEYFDDRINMLITNRNQANAVLSGQSEADRSIAADMGTPNAALISQRTYTVNAKISNQTLTQEDLQAIASALSLDHSESYVAASTALGTASAVASGVLSTIKNLGQRNPKIGIFINDVPQFATLNVTPNLGSGMFHQALNGMFEMQRISDAQDQHSPEFSLRSFASPEAGYYPNNYHYQAFLGFALGKMNDRSHWSSPYKIESGTINSRTFSGKITDEYTAQCLMNFVADSRCMGPNKYSTMIRLVGIVKAVIQLIASIFSGGSADSANEGFKAFTDTLIEKVAEESGNAAKDQMEDEIGNFASDAWNDALNNAKAQATQKIDREMKTTISESMPNVE